VTFLESTRVSLVPIAGIVALAFFLAVKGKKNAVVGGSRAKLPA
jgi:hypothetical protein